jgi:hypothetical protein
MANTGAMILDDGDPRGFNVQWKNLNIAEVATMAGDGFSVTGTVSVNAPAAASWGVPMHAALLDEPEDDVPLEEARRIAAHRHRTIEGLLGDRPGD